MTKKTFKKAYKRILEISEDHKQVTLPDSRYYKRNEEYYPSITHVLSVYPKGKQFEEWLKQVGFSANYLVERAAEEGSKVHKMIEQYLEGAELTFFSPIGDPIYDPKVWQMFLKFVEFWEEYKPTLIETEVFLFSDELKVAGTCDLICEIEIDEKKEIWVIDFKTSNGLYTSYDLQTAVYVKCFEENYEIPIDRQGILWLKSKKRKPAKGKIQGAGWELYESPRTQEENLHIFKIIKELFDIENPLSAPITTTFKTTIKREL